jgi:trans-aconitate methyltransferase
VRQADRYAYDENPVSTILILSSDDTAELGEIRQKLANIVIGGRELSFSGDGNILYTRQRYRPDVLQQIFYHWMPQHHPTVEWSIAQLAVPKLFIANNQDPVLNI